MRVLTLFGTSGCHLCEVAEQLLQYVLTPEWQLDYADIAYDTALVERYGVRIPVLRDESSGSELGWPFDEQMLRQFLVMLPEIAADPSG